MLLQQGNLKTILRLNYKNVFCISSSYTTTEYNTEYNRIVELISIYQRLFWLIKTLKLMYSSFYY